MPEGKSFSSLPELKSSIFLLIAPAVVSMSLSFRKRAALSTIAFCSTSSLSLIKERKNEGSSATIPITIAHESMMQVTILRRETYSRRTDCLVDVGSKLIIQVQHGRQEQARWLSYNEVRGPRGAPAHIKGLSLR